MIGYVEDVKKDGSALNVGRAGGPRWCKGCRYGWGLARASWEAME